MDALHDPHGSRRAVQSFFTRARKPHIKKAALVKARLFLAGKTESIGASGPNGRGDDRDANHGGSGHPGNDNHRVR